MMMYTVSCNTVALAFTSNLNCEQFPGQCYFYIPETGERTCSKSMMSDDTSIKLN